MILNGKFNLNKIVLMSCLFFVCTVFFVCKTFIYDARILRKWDEARKCYCYFIGLGDFHDKAHEVTQKQICQIDEIINACRPLRTKLILEDICSEPNNGMKFCNQFNINSTGGILGAIADRYRKSVEDISSFYTKQDNANKSLDKNCDNLDKNSDKEICFKNNYVDNVEYRFCRVASLAPVINNIDCDCNKFLSTSKIFVNCFKKEIMGVINEIKNYQDCQALKNFYNTSINNVFKQMDALGFEKNSKNSIAQYLNLICGNDPKNKLNFVKKLLVFDSCLLDAKILHSIFLHMSGVSLKSEYKQNFIVIAGGSHIRNVASVLESLGFEKVYESGVSLAALDMRGFAASMCQNKAGVSNGVNNNSLNNNDSLSSVSQNSSRAGINVNQSDFINKPAPVDLSVLKKFI